MTQIDLKAGIKGLGCGTPQTLTPKILKVLPWQQLLPNISQNLNSSRSTWVNIF